MSVLLWGRWAMGGGSTQGKEGLGSELVEAVIDEARDALEGRVPARVAAAEDGELEVGEHSNAVRGVADPVDKLGGVVCRRMRS